MSGLLAGSSEFRCHSIRCVSPSWLLKTPWKKIGGVSFISVYSTLSVRKEGKLSSQFWHSCQETPITKANRYNKEREGIFMLSFSMDSFYAVFFYYYFFMLSFSVGKVWSRERYWSEAKMRAGMGDNGQGLPADLLVPHS